MQITGSNPVGGTESNRAKLGETKAKSDLAFNESLFIREKFDFSLNMNGFFVYVLLSQKDGKFYVGFSEDLDKRLKEHFDGRVASTKYRLPLKLIHYEYFINKSDAKAREVFLKSGFGREQLKKSLKNTLKNRIKRID